MSWKNDYRAKLTVPEEAVKRIRSGDRVFLSGNAAIPSRLVEALAARHEELENVQLSHLLLLGEDPFSRPEMKGSFRHNSLFVGPADRKAVNDGRGDYVPIFLYQIPRVFEERIVPLDAAMVQVSPPDRHGFMSLGVEVLTNKAACLAAKTVIVEVNEKTPRMHGDSFLHVDQADAIVESDVPLPTLQCRPATETELAIGRSIAALIEEGATIQMGIGGIPDAVYAYLDGASDLGIHSEMFSDGAMRAVERGLVNGRRKTLHKHKVVFTFALGSAELYDYLNDNPMAEARPVDYVNDPYVISRNAKMTAVNSALEVDITGQVCSDSIGARIYSGVGGQVDFIRGAARSRGGKPIIALPSTAKEGALSRIVPKLKPGAGVVTSRADVHYVVTEHGTANLFGRNLRERAESLIGIAHPDFRDDLEREAKERGLL